jgi:hypothetical protein
MVHHVKDHNKTMLHLLLDTADYHKPEQITFEECVIQWNGTPDELRHALTVALNNAFEGKKI